MDPKTEAIALRIGSRWFHRFGRKKQVLTAWTLAGATLFHCRSDAMAMSEAIAARRGTAPELVRLQPVSAE